MFGKGLAKSVNGQILYNGIKMEMFVPDDFFKNGLAEEIGTNYYVFGNLRTLHYTTKDTDREHAEQAFLYYPLKFYTSPDEVAQEKIDFGNGLEKYYVFTYYKNGVIFTTDEMIKDANNAQYFVTLLMDGKLDMIRYDKIAKMLQLCKYYNSINFEVPAIYEEVIISDYYRDPDDISKPARFRASETDKKMFYARGITQREKVAFSSTFAGVTFEDMISMLTMADNAKRDNREEVISDVEKVSLGLI